MIRRSSVGLPQQHWTPKSPNLEILNLTSSLISLSIKAFSAVFVKLNLFIFATLMHQNLIRLRGNHEKKIIMSWAGNVERREEGNSEEDQQWKTKIHSPIRKTEAAVAVKK